MKRDLDIIYTVSSFLSTKLNSIFYWLEIPITMNEFMKVLID